MFWAEFTRPLAARDGFDNVQRHVRVESGYSTWRDSSDKAPIALRGNFSPRLVPARARGQEPGRHAFEAQGKRRDESRCPTFQRRRLAALEPRSFGRPGTD